MASIPLKRCHNCGFEYPATREFFYTDPRSTDGFRNPCKPCRGVVPTNTHKRDVPERTISQGVIRLSFRGGHSVLVDECDADLLDRNWYVKTCGHENYYCARSTRKDGRQICVYLHREILGRIIGRGLTAQEQVDHVNGASLDNRRSNLRMATRGQNQRNMRMHRDATSGYKGAHYDKARNKYIATIMVNGKQYHLGRFDTAIEAHEAYCEAAVRLHGEFARLK